MTIRHLQVFVTVCEHGSMNQAAKALFISQPTVSQSIAELEDHYHIRAFERLSRRLFITEDGTRLLNYARHVLALHDEMDVVFMQGKNVPPLRIGATITVATCILNDFLQNFSNLDPKVKTRIVVDNTAQIEDQLLQNKLDVGIVEGEIRDPALEIYPIMNDELVLVCAPGHPYAKQQSIPLKALESFPFIFREKGSGTRERFEQQLTMQQISVEENWTCNNSEAIKNAVMAGQGLTVISKMLVEQEVNDGLLCNIEIEDVHLSRMFHFVIHKNKYRSESIQIFQQAIQLFRKS